jgi:hypothetical protein
MEVTNVKKITIFLVCVVMIFSLSACGGNIKNVKVVDVESEIYTSDDIKSAIETIEKEFDKDWKGCTLKEIYYAGDETSKNYQDWADRNNADEVIVLLSSFDVDSSGGDGSLNPNSTYDGWNWILVRNKGGQWKHVDHGY